MLNHVYRVIYNQATGCYVAVSEITKSAGKTSGRSGQVGSTLMLNAANLSATNLICLLKRSVLTLAVASVTGLGFMASSYASTCNGGDASNSQSTAAVCGRDAIANGKHNVVVGHLAFTSQANDLTLLGAGSKDKKEVVRESTAVGAYSHARADNSTAVGAYSLVAGYQGTAVGYNSISKGNGSSAFGVRSSSRGLASTALGYFSSASANNSIAMGPNSLASGSNSLASGSNSLASGINSTASGTYTGAFGESSVALGGGDNTTLAIGINWNYNYLPVMGNFSVDGQGRRYVLDNNNNPVYEYKNYVYTSTAKSGAISAADKAIAIGRGTFVDIANGVALGANSTVLGEHSTAIGGGTNKSVAVGDTSQANAGYNGSTAAVYTDALGRNYNLNRGTKVFQYNAYSYNSDANTGAIAVGDSSIASGAGSQAVGSNSSAYGVNSRATQDNSTAMGVNSQALGDSSTATGVNSTASGTSSTASGTSSTASGAGSTALGAGSTALQTRGIALGGGDLIINNMPTATTAALSTADNAIAIGRGTHASIANGVALGAQSRTNVDAGEVGYNAPANLASQDARWKATHAAVSVGDTSDQSDPTTWKTRQITGVAAGSADTDAVNVAQLKTVSTTANGAITFAADTGTNVTRKLGDTLSIKGGTTGNIGVTTDTVNNGLIIQLAQNINLGNSGSVTTGNTVLNTSGITIANGANPVTLTASGLNNGDNKITGVGKGTNDGDAVNFAQLKKVGQYAGQANLVMYDTINRDNITLGYINATTPTGITNLKAGELNATSTDAVNGSQLSATNNQVSSNSSNITSNSNKIASNSTNISANSTNIAANASNITANSQSISEFTGSVDAVINNVNNIAKVIGATDLNGNVIDGSGNTLVDKDGKPLTVEQALTTYQVANQGEVANSTVVSAIHSMNEEGIKFFHSNDKTAGSQYASKSNNSQDSSAAGAYSTAIGYDAKTDSTANNALAIGRGAHVAGSNSIAIGTGASAKGKSSISLGEGNQVNGNNSGAIGDPSVINANNAYSVGNNNTIGKKANNTFVMGNEVTTNVANSVALGNQTVITAGNKTGTANAKANGSKGNTTTAGATGKVNGFAGAKASGAVSVGASGSERRIQNVAAGEVSATSTDAVNGSQLYNTQAQTMGYAKQQANDVEDKMSAGVASAIALAYMPTSSIPGSIMISGGTGYFNNQGALAVGITGTSNTGMMSYKVGGSYTQDAGSAVGVGVGFRIR